MRDLTLSIPQGVSQKKTKVSSSRANLNYFILILIAILGLTYFMVTDSLSTKGLQIKKLDSELDGLQSEQKTLQLQSSNLQSINLIENKAQTLGFVPTTDVTYLKGSNFALK